jgi:hypothetical protein
MLKKTATIKTVQARRYLQMLCKHFKHKVSAGWDEEQGWVEFAMGRCELNCTNDLLQVHCQANNADDLQEITETVKSHFDRFAQKQQLTLQWSN